MAKQQANFPIITFQKVLSSPIYVKIIYPNTGFDKTYTINPGTYSVFLPDAESSHTYGNAFNATSSITKNNGTIPALLGSFLWDFLKDLYTAESVGGNPQVRVDYAKYATGSVINPATFGSFVSPASVDYSLGLDPTLNQEIHVLFSQDLANFSLANPEVNNVAGDIMGGTNTNTFWSLFGWGFYSGTKSRCYVFKEDAGIHKLINTTTFSGNTRFGYIPLYGVFHPNQDVFQDERTQVSAVGFAKNRFNNTSAIKQWGNKRTLHVSVFPYIVAAKIWKYKRDDEKYWNQLDIRGFPTIIETIEIARGITTWEDVYDAVLNNQELTIIYDPVFPAPTGFRERVTGKWMDERTIQDWGETISDAADGKFYQITLALEENV